MDPRQKDCLQTAPGPGDSSGVGKRGRKAPKGEYHSNGMTGKRCTWVTVSCPTPIKKGFSRAGATKKKGGHWTGARLLPGPNQKRQTPKKTRRHGGGVREGNIVRRRTGRIKVKAAKKKKKSCPTRWKHPHVVAYLKGRSPAGRDGAKDLSAEMRGSHRVINCH